MVPIDPKTVVHSNHRTLDAETRNKRVSGRQTSRNKRIPHTTNKNPTWMNAAIQQHGHVPKFQHVTRASHFLARTQRGKRQDVFGHCDAIMMLFKCRRAGEEERVGSLFSSGFQILFVSTTQQPWKRYIILLSGKGRRRERHKVKTRDGFVCVVVLSWSIVLADRWCGAGDLITLMTSF